MADAVSAPPTTSAQPEGGSAPPPARGGQQVRDEDHEVSKPMTEVTLPNEQSKKVTEFLQTILGRPVIVKLNSGVDYRGVLACLDSFMNIAMEQTEEYADGQLKAKYGDCFIRGNNVLYIATQKKPGEAPKGPGFRL